MDSRWFTRAFGAEAKKHLAAYHTERRAILINGRAEYWLNGPAEAESRAAQYHRTGFWSTASPLHPIRHELGHLAHHEHDPFSWQANFHGTLPQEAIRDLQGQVSLLALQEPLELVAEVFAGILDGRSYGPNVMPWYRRFGGRDLR